MIIITGNTNQHLTLLNQYARWDRRKGHWYVSHYPPEWLEEVRKLPGVVITERPLENQHPS